MTAYVEAALSETQLYGYAIRLLSKRDYSESSLRNKLKTKSNNSSLIDKVLLRVIDLGYLSDSQYVQNFITSSVLKKRGPIWIRAKLREKGLSDPLVQEIIGDVSIDWESLAESLFHERFKSECVDKKERSRRIRYLISKGYPSSIVMRVID